MFGIFKKKKEAPAPDPAQVKMSEQIKEQTEIAELQSQISELRRQSAQMNADIARKQDERAALMAKIQSVPQAQKTALALRVKNIDKYVAGLNGNLALLEQQIGNIESTILQKGGAGIVDIGDIANTVDVKSHQDKLLKAREKKDAGDTNVAIADGMLAELTGDATSISDDIAGILAEAEGSSQTAQGSQTVSAEEGEHSLPSMPMSQY